MEKLGKKDTLFFCLTLVRKKKMESSGFVINRDELFQCDSDGYDSLVTCSGDEINVDEISFEIIERLSNKLHLKIVFSKVKILIIS